MIDEPDTARCVAPQHAAYRQGLNLPAYLGGPFADRSGGLITFEGESTESAERLVADDPFVRLGLLQRRWLEHWFLD
jgi:hypothetical protein